MTPTDEYMDHTVKCVAPHIMLLATFAWGELREVRVVRYHNSYTIRIIAPICDYNAHVYYILSPKKPYDERLDWLNEYLFDSFEHVDDDDLRTFALAKALPVILADSFFRL